MLETVRQEYENFFWSYLFGFGQDELIIDRHKGSSGLFLAYAETPANDDQQGEQNADNHSPDPAVKKEVFSPDYRKNKGQGAAQTKEDQAGENDCDDQWKTPVNIG
jgi:hypothetical protein